MPLDPPRGLPLPALAAYINNSAIYFKTFWQPCSGDNDQTQPGSLSLSLHRDG